MSVVVVSPKYQVVIPRSVREKMKLQPGDRLEVLEYDQRLQLIPVRDMKQARGMLRGMDTTVDREKEDRL